jgi:transposase
MELVRSGRSVLSVAREFDVSRASIITWMKRDDLDSGRRDDGLTTDERKELTSLRRENKRLRLEQEILSKAAAWFARETNTLPNKSSDS